MTSHANELSLAAGTVLDAGPAGTLRAAASAGFDAAGLRLDPAAVTPAEAAELRGLADDLGVRVLDLEVVRLGPAGSLDDHLRLLELAGILGARYLLTTSGHPDPSATTADLERLCAAAAGGPTLVAFEFMMFTAVGTLAEALTLTPPEAVVLVDPLHLHRGGTAPEAIAGLTAERLGYLQLCDAPAAAPGDGGPEALANEARHHRLPPGAGDLPLAALFAHAPAGLPLSVEVQSEDLTARFDPPARAKHLLELARSFLGSL
ncbi:TIM barrel protein [Pseudonocardia ailaonensis]|uniref:TIM barrel protein n=1 Tax=Pseudonocardia ailaonensis TaxID=367279 RepID=A0ABN2NGA1_9PSEU